MSELDIQNPEVLLVAGALLKPALAAEASRYVDEADFHDKRLGRIWAKINEMINEGLKDDAIDAVSVSRRFGNDPESQRKVARYCGDLLDMPVMKSLVVLAQRVRKRSTMRNVRTELEKLHEELDREIESADGDIPNLDERLGDLSISVTKKLDSTQRRTTYQQYTKEITNYLDDLASSNGNYIPTDIPKLDSKLGGGLRPGQLHAILGGTGGGKTALASQLCDAAVKHGYRAIMFSMEVDPFDVYIRDVERRAGRSRWDLKDPGMKDFATAALIQAHAELANMTGKIVYAEPISIEGIRQAILTERLRGGPVHLVAVDHAQVALPSAKDKASMPRYLVVKGVAEGLRALARNLKVAVILTAQLNPPARDKDGKSREASMEDVRESKDINNTAEVVLVISHKYEKDDPIPIESAIKIEKIRAGRAGKVPIKYRGDIFRYEEPYAIPTESEPEE